VSASQLEIWVFDPWPLSESPVRSLGMSVHLNYPGKKHISGVGLPLIAVTKIIYSKTYCRFHKKLPAQKASSPFFASLKENLHL